MKEPLTEHGRGSRSNTPHTRHVALWHSTRSVASQCNWVVAGICAATGARAALEGDLGFMSLMLMCSLCHLPLAMGVSALWTLAWVLLSNGLLLHVVLGASRATRVNATGVWIWHGLHGAG
eukprot:CAMPEP_0202860258 /NCGR_PEP_ID=MMETSP1391-20130828/2040_1 /ASSEMBLY_ACC=CAM_ASM_000867 /TAXON_ID=1034604 /ORGANISM="Chlamydomonas leiostraca, Strain SAG 11-49" /LENGTH=120 /DNA_ID=CAMNT_0049539401 /DNA_START=102 /DNA_END=464 /DNA_ORIENTATION=+